MSINNRFKGEEFPESWTLAKRVVIPKKGQELSHPQSYLPISLLNVEYKILTSILAARIGRVIGQYIHGNQTGFILSR